MSSAIALVVLPLLLQNVQATFPPVSNAPPIPSQGVRTMDYERFYFPGDLPPNQPSNVIKDEGYFQGDEKLDQKLYAPENQSGETGAFGNSEDTFDRYYSEDQPYIGPVATPLPDDTYVAQPSVTSKVIPDNPSNVGSSSDIWVLTKGPDNQFIRERWIQVPVTQDRVVEVVNADIPPKQYTETIKSFPPVAQPPPLPPAPAPVKAPVPAPPSIVQQVWIRAPSPIQAQKVIQNPPTVVEDIPSVKQVVDVSPPAIKQYIQPQIIKEAQPLPPPPPPPPPTVTKKSSSFIVPPPPPPPLKVPDFASPKQTVVVSQPPVPVDQIVVEKSAPLSQVKHIWVPTSQNTGKFLTVPVGTVIDGGKSVPAKGVPLDVQQPPSPITVSDTWILKQDGPIPRFEQQKSFAPVAPVIQKGSVIVDNGPKVQFDSPKNPPLVGKSIDTAVPIDIWPAKNPVPQQKVFISQPPPPPPPPAVALPPPSGKSDTIVVGKSSPIAPPPKGIISSVKGIPQFPPPPPSLVAPLPQVINGKPCPLPIVQTKSPFPPKSVPVPVPAPAPAPVAVPVPAPAPAPVYRTIAIPRQPFGRILRINRYPYGPYYVLNPRTGASFYTYPRAPIAPVIQQTKTGQVVRLVPARPLAVSVAPRQVAVPVSPKQVTVPVSPKQVAVPAPRKQIVLPISNGKSAAPVLLYPPVSRIRYAYPWGSYIRSLPVAGKNIFVLPPNNKPAKIQAAKSSSSESSSSESSSSESKSSEKKSKPKEEKKSSEEEEEVAESIGSIESEEPEPEKAPEPIIEEVEEEEEETAASEAEPEQTAAPAVVEEKEEEPEAKDESFAAEESQVKPQLLNGNKEPNVNSFDSLTKSFYYGFDQRGVPGHKEISDPDGKRVIGSYNYRKPDGIFKNVAYVVDANGSRAHVVSNEPGTVSYQTVNTNYIPNATPENITNKVPDIENAASHENLTEDPQRD
ncbi:hypothetical protein HNY73_020654 [Argiope bruennichi]|uniref:Uncharacterized protein n=2 Tax=Argiope bruennichi TaxID=94029 RepID=A0A8T0E8D9_ARGBR|nr:hypothetical protein HNY73_020654 [Argiope bruennichi]